MAVLVGRHLRYDWDEPGVRGQRPPHLLQGTRLAPAVLDLQGGRRGLRRGADDQLPALRLPAGGAPHPGAALGRRGHRLARPGPPRRGGRGAGRQVPGRAALPGLGPVRRQRDGRGLDLGGPGQGLVLQAGQPDRDRRRQPARPARSRPSCTGTSTPTPRARPRSAPACSSSTATTWPPSTRPWPRRAI